MFLGYSFLQIPDFILLIVVRAKRKQNGEGRDQHMTKTVEIIVHEDMSASQGRSKRESNKDYVGINAHNELIARIEHLENQQGQLNAHICH